MSNVIGLDHLRGKASRGGGGSDGGSVDDILKRLGVLESSNTEIRTQLGAIAAVLPHLATKADVSDLRTEISGCRVEIGSVKADVSALAAVIPHLATKAEMQGVRAEMQGIRVETQGIKADIKGMESALIKWIVGTTLGAATLAFAIAKFVS
jgi:hypothetical protein